MHRIYRGANFTLNCSPKRIKLVIAFAILIGLIALPGLSAADETQYPEIVVSTDMIDFGLTEIGDTKVSSFTISNIGDEDLILHDLSMTYGTSAFSYNIVYVSNPPVAVADSYSITSDSWLHMNPPGVLANDYDYDGDSLAAVLLDDVEHGTLTLNPDGSFTYTPYPAFVGNDEFSYMASDGEKLSAPNLVSIEVIEPVTPTVIYDQGDPIDGEQYILELINRARSDPWAEGIRLGIDIQEGLSEPVVPMPPLTMNADLLEVARAHSEDMYTRDYYDHYTPEGVAPWERVSASDYAGAFNFEAIFSYYGNTIDSVNAFELVYEVWMTEPMHRGGLLGLEWSSGNEAGIGIYSDKITFDIGVSWDIDTFITGVVYDDLDGDNFYDPGEGLSGVTVMPSMGEYYAVTSSSGGYAIPVLIEGTYELTASGDGVGDPVVKSTYAIPSGDSIKLDFETTSAGGPTPASILPANGMILSSDPILVYDHGDPIDGEQYILELINRARSDPWAEGIRLGIDIQEGLSEPVVPMPPLTMNADLLEVARAHSEDMYTRDYYDHYTPEGVSPWERVSASDYAGTGDFEAIFSLYGESIDSVIEFDLVYEAWMIEPMHRSGLLGLEWSSGNEVGIGIYGDRITLDMGRSYDIDAFITGVVYNDLDGDNFYDPGEGLSGVTVMPSMGEYYAVTSSSGGYAIPVTTDGPLSVIANGGALSEPITEFLAVTASGYSVKQDFMLGSLNIVPIANNDVYSSYTAFISISAPGVLANDYDSDEDSLESYIVSEPSFGTVFLNQDGSFSYTRTDHNAESDSFMYIAWDGLTYSEPATVIINFFDKILLSPLGECEIQIIFTPLHEGIFSETFTIQSNDPVYNVKTVDLLGYGVGVGVDWIRQFGTSDFDLGLTVYSHPTGIYLVGGTEGSMPAYTNNGGRDALIVKFDHDGNQIWSSQFGTAGNDNIHGISIDSSGVYVVGDVHGALPGQSWSGLSDSFIQKYDFDGTILWTHQFGGTGHDSASGISILGGNIFVSGGVEGALPGQTGNGGFDAFVCRFDSDGNEVWTNQFGTSGDDYAKSVSSDVDGLYVVGYCTGALPQRNWIGARDAFVMRCSLDGVEDWTIQYGTTEEDDASDCIADPSGAYIVGYTRDALPLQNHLGGADAYILKVDSTGSIEWIDQFGSSLDDLGVEISEFSGHLYMCGTTAKNLPDQTSFGLADGFVRKYSSNGQNLWTHQFGSVGFDLATGISVGAGGVYVSGYTDDAMPTQTHIGSFDAYLVKLAALNTEAGSDVEFVDSNTNVVVQFEGIESPGMTSVEVVDDGPLVPAGFFAIGTYYDIHTTSTFAGTINISIPYDEMSVISESDVRLMHWDSVSESWEDVTTWVDTEANFVHGEVDSLSIFIVVEQDVIDSDKDGLEDDYERLIGTLPDNPDTDGDGILDGDEVLIYGTDPLTDFDYYVPIGDFVEIIDRHYGIELTFADVTKAGVVTLMIGDPGPAPPVGFYYISDFYDVQTSRVVYNLISVNLPYDGNLAQSLDNLRMLEYDGDWSLILSKYNMNLHHYIHFASTSLKSFALMEMRAIFIDGDSGFELIGQDLKTGCPGSGTEADPYRIENFVFSGSTNLIHIQGTTAWFKITGCQLDGVDNSHHGIYLYNVMNGEVTGNVIDNCLTGIFVEESSNVEVSGNTFNNCTFLILQHAGSVWYIPSPTGIPETDYAFIQDALDHMISGETIQLAAGDYYVHRPLVKDGFSGTIKGAGKDITIIVASKGSNGELFPSIYVPEFDGRCYLGPNYLTNTTFLLYLPHCTDSVTLLDMTLAIDTIGIADYTYYNNTEVQEIRIDTDYGNNLAYAVYLVITSECDTIFNNVKLVGVNDGTQFFSQPNHGIVIDSFYLSETELGGSHTARSCDFIGLGTNSYQHSYLKNAQILVDSCTFTDCTRGTNIFWSRGIDIHIINNEFCRLLDWGVWILESEHCEAIITNNDFINLGMSAVVLSRLIGCSIDVSNNDMIQSSAVYLSTQDSPIYEKNTYVFQFNEIKMKDNHNYAGFEIHNHVFDMDWADLEISNNTIDCESNYLYNGPIFAINAHYAVISDNTIIGSGPFAIYLRDSGHGLIIEENDFHHWITADPLNYYGNIAPIYLCESTNQCTVYCYAYSEVLDLGTDNQIYLVTSTGQNSQVIDESTGVTIIFDKVYESGGTLIQQIDTPTEAPGTFMIGDFYYSITTTASYSGTITIAIQYNPNDFNNEESLKLKHWNSTTGKWDKITTEVDIFNHIIYGETTSFSMFAIMEDTIFIDNDADFEALGFPGLGTEEKPYRIENYLFMDNTDLIHIQDTTAFFVITGCQFNGIDGAQRAIYLRNVVNGNVSYNTFENCAAGVRIEFGSGLIVEGNEIHDCYSGILIRDSTEVIARNNFVIIDTLANSAYGYLITRSTYIDLINNYAIDYQYGVYIAGSSRYNNILDNDFEGCYRHIYLQYCGFNTLTGNNFHIGAVGIYLYATYNNTVSENMAYGLDHGLLAGNSENNTIWSNYAEDCVYGFRGGTISHFNFTNNIAINCRYGFLVQYSSDNLFVSNTISAPDVDSYTWGFELYRFSSSIITENVISDTDAGIRLYESNGNVAIDNTFTNTGTGIILYSSNGNSIIENICNGNLLVGISIQNSSDNEICNNTCNDNGEHGILLNYSNSDNNVTGNTCEGNGFYGIFLYFSNDNYVINNTCNNNLYIGVSLFNSGGNEIRDNICTGNGEHGIRIDSSDLENIVTGNICERNGLYGIFLYNSHDSDIIGNTCNDNQVGIYLIESSENDVINNECNVNLYTGIRTLNAHDNEIRGNTCNDNGEDGIYLESSGPGNVVIDNTCNGNAWFGILFYDSHENEVLENMCNLNGEDGILLRVSHNNEVTENICEHNVYAGIYLDQANGNNATRNTCDYNTIHGIHVLWSESNTIANNSCNGSDHYGIRVEFSNNNIVVNNTCSSNTIVGIELSDSHYNTVANNTCNNQDMGINILDSGHNEILENTCNDDCGINLLSTFLTVVTDNDCSGSIIGILIGDSNNNQVFGNDCSECEEYGIILDTCTSSVLTNNTCNENDFGIFLIYSHENYINGSECNGNGNFGIYLESSNSNTVSDNECDGNGWFGIYLVDSHSNTISNNICTGNLIGIYLNISTENDVISNTCNNNLYDGLYLYGSENNILVGNICNGNERRGITINMSNNNQVAGNSFSYNTKIGIRVMDSIGNQITGNTCNFNENGIYLSDSNGNFLVRNTCDGNTGNAIVLDSSNENQLVENTCTGNNQQSTGILLDGSSGNNLIGNPVSFFDRGISVFGTCRDNLLTYNNIMDCRTGIIFSYTSENRADTNQLYDCKTGIAIVYSSNISLIENNVYEYNFRGDVFHQSYGYRVANSFNCTLADNTYFSNLNEEVYGTNYAYSLYRSDNITLIGNDVISTGDICETTYGFHILYSENCTLAHNTVDISSIIAVDLPSIYGIYLESSINGTLERNRISINLQYDIFRSALCYGVYLYKSDYSNHSRNIVEIWDLGDAKGCGVRILESHFCMISEYYVSVQGCRRAYGMHISTSHNNILYDNTAEAYSDDRGGDEDYFGLYLEYSNFNDLVSNTFTGYHIKRIHDYSFRFGGKFLFCENNYLWNNTFHGSCILSTASSGADTTGLVMTESNNNTLVNNAFIGGSYDAPPMSFRYATGLHLGNSHFNLISMNSIIAIGYTRAHGIEIHSSNYNNFTRNTFSLHVEHTPSAFYNGKFPFKLSHSHDNSISNHTIRSSSIGIDLYESSRNVIYHNNFIDNLFWDVRESMPCVDGNYYYHPEWLEGNFWDTYIGVDLDRDGIGDTHTPWPDVGFDPYPLVIADSDGDGISDSGELIIGTDPNSVDTDSDTLNDGDEWGIYFTNPLAKDSEGDGLRDDLEIQLGTNPWEADTDGDGWDDIVEYVVHHTDPTLDDTDGDGIKDRVEKETYGLDPLNPDMDADGLSDGEEIFLGADGYITLPKDKDTDDDGITDGDEFLFGTDPTKGVDVYTPAGKYVEVVDPNTDTSIEFNYVSEPGATTVEVHDTGPAPPSGFKIAGFDQYWLDITTTVDFTPPVTIGLSYGSMPIFVEANLKLMHYNEELGVWEDITTWIDFTNNIIYGVTDSFSLFTIMEIIDYDAPVTTLILDPSREEAGQTYILSGTLFTLSRTDDLAGVDFTEYKIDDGPWMTYTGPFTNPVLGPDDFTIYYRSTDLVGNVEVENSLYLIVEASKLTYTGDETGTYSDPVALSAVLIDIVTLEPIVGRTVTFTIGSQTETGTTDSTGTAYATIVLDQPAGDYTVDVEFIGDSEYLEGTDSVAFDLRKETALLTYTGNTVVPTTVDTITLRATVFDDDDGYWGDITNGYVTFAIYATPVPDDWSTLLLIDFIQLELSDTMGVGVAYYDIDNLNEGGYLIYVVFNDDANHYYDGPWSEPVVLTVYEPTGDFVTGGGWIYDDDGRKANFGFNVKYKKNGLPKGQSIFVYRTDGWEYVIKSNAWLGMAIDEQYNHAFFEGKCTVQKFNTETGEMIWDEGNYQFRVDVWDYDEDGSIDEYGICVLDKDGIVYYEAGPILLGGGNIIIHFEAKDK